MTAKHTLATIAEWLEGPRPPDKETARVLFEEKVKARWKGRTETNKLVFVESETDLRGQALPVKILWAGPWSMIGAL